MTGAEHTIVIRAGSRAKGPFDQALIVKRVECCDADNPLHRWDPELWWMGMCPASEIRLRESEHGAMMYSWKCPRCGASLELLSNGRFTCDLNPRAILMLWWTS